MTEVKFPTEMMEQMQNMMKNVMPTITPSKNGYEIRTKVLDIANTAVWNDYNAKWGQFNTKVTKDGDELVTTVDLPESPGTTEVLEAAEKFYAFVSGKGPK
jgi:hypothetical protein